jgi:hypothetical protein
MFRALLAHPQKALHIQHLVYCACVMSVGCYQFHSNTGSSQRIKHARNIPSDVCVAPPEDEQVMLETCTVLNS